jgi:hypothetical protein
MKISKLLDANMIEKFAYLPSLIGMDVTDGEVIVINSGIPSGMFNIVCRTKKQRRDDAPNLLHPY